MLKSVFTVLVAGICTLGLVGPSTQQAEACPGSKAEMAEKSHADKLAWRSDLKQALADAKASSKPAVVYVGTDACGACDQLVDKTLTNDKVRQALKGFVTVHADATSAKPELPKGVEVGAMPALLFVNAKGEVIKSLKIEKFIPAKDFLALIKKAQATS